MAELINSATDQKLADLEKARAWSPRLVSKIDALIHDQDPWALYRVNPLKFAKDRGIDESETIDLFLHATHLGIFKMEWHLICPSCGDAVESFSSLSGLHSHFDCTMCQESVDAQLDDFIEISFSISPVLRDCPFHHPLDLSIEDFYFKLHYSNGAHPPGGGPPFREILKSAGLAIGYVGPHETRVFEFEVKGGFIIGHDMVKDQGWFCPIVGEAAAETQEIRLRAEEGGVTPAKLEVRPGKVRISYENTHDVRVAPMMGNLPPGYFEHKVPMEIPPYLTGNRLLVSQSFRNLFRSETIQGSEGIGIRNLTLLFTDLKGSTEMYERIGDLKAFSLVQQHFEHLTRAIQSHRGAVVKTIGDAVMACFDKPSDAVAAALLMLDEIETFNRQQGSNEIILKIGVHKGASIAVTLNDRLDYFGQTVNIAARVQGVAGAEEICVTKSVYDSPGVQEQLQHFKVAPEQASLKGVSKKMAIWRISEQGPAKPAFKAPKAAKKAASKGKPKPARKAKAKAKKKPARKGKSRR